MADRNIPKMTTEIIDHVLNKTNVYWSEFSYNSLWWGIGMQRFQERIMAAKPLLGGSQPGLIFVNIIWIISLFQFSNSSVKNFLCFAHIYFSFELGVYFLIVVFFTIFRISRVYV